MQSVAEFVGILDLTPCAHAIYWQLAMNRPGVRRDEWLKSRLYQLGLFCPDRQSPPSALSKAVLAIKLRPAMLRLRISASSAVA